MAYIEVNHQMIRQLASAVDSYCDVHTGQIRSMDSKVKHTLQYDWLGLDSMEFGKKWERIDDPTSVMTKFQTDMKNYSQALTNCANAYSKAQVKAYNRAYYLLQF